MNAQRGRGNIQLCERAVTHSYKERKRTHGRVQLLCFCLDFLKLGVKHWCNTQLAGLPVLNGFIKTVSDTVPHRFNSLIDPASAADPVISAGWLTQLV